ncbi:hypothetical protein AEQ67_15010 [Pseudomonas sp. RIT-PI-q]|nr:hypothetical protein AEQ67_15010 [Pseudomonas sp. RIT-PI-q]
MLLRMGLVDTAFLIVNIDISTGKYLGGQGPSMKMWTVLSPQSTSFDTKSMQSEIPPLTLIGHKVQFCKKRRFCGTLSTLL